MVSNNNESFPLEIHRATEKESAEVYKYYQENHVKYFVRVGTQGYFFTNTFADIISPIYNLGVRTDDVFVVSYPKAGTTLTQELVWMIANNCDYDTAKSVPLFERFRFLELEAFMNSDVLKERIKRAIDEDELKKNIATRLNESTLEALAKMPSPRFMRTHQPFSLLPPDVLKKAKVVYVARDPRDVAVSYFHQQKSMLFYSFKGDFKDFWDLFKKDLVEWSPFFSHFREAWALKDHPNVLFLFYEDLLKDMPAAIRRVAKFLGKVITEDQVAKLCQHLKFDNFKKNKMVNYSFLGELGIMEKSGEFVRKGKAGGWRDYFDEEMTRDAERWMEEGLKGIDCKF